MVKRLFRRSLRVPAVATPNSSKKVIQYRRDYLLKGKIKGTEIKHMDESGRKDSVI